MKRSLRTTVSAPMLAALVGVLASPELFAQAPPAGHSVFAGVALPDEVGIFSLREATRYPDPAYGVGLGYQSEEVRGEATIYVYPIADGVEDAVGSEFDAAWAELQQYAATNRTGVELELGEIIDVTVTGGDGSRYAGRLGETTMRGNGMTLTSLLYVFTKDDSYIKYRVTYERASRRLMEEPLLAFLSETLTHVAVVER